MRTNIAIAALASCVSFGASAQSFFDTFDNGTFLPQWSFSPTTSVINAIGSDDYLYVAAAQGPINGFASFSFNTVAAATSVQVSFLYAGQGDPVFNPGAGAGTIQFSSGNFSGSLVLPAFGFTTDNPGPLGRSFAAEFFTLIPQGAAATLRFQGGFPGMNIDNVRITAVPEPGTYALMMAGLGFMGFLARRRLSARS